MILRASDRPTTLVLVMRVDFYSYSMELWFGLPECREGNSQAFGRSIMAASGS
jgi:hypothetical protein